MDQSSSPRPPHPALAGFHPAVAAWFARQFEAPTEAQARAWPAIAQGRHTLVAAPTGSGKTLTAFLTAIDALVREGLAHGGGLADAVDVVYVSPLKALSNDIHVNLEAPLAGIREELARMGLPDVDIRTSVRTGDTSQAERNAMRKRPPQILVTTPESLYVLLGSESGRAALATTRSVIVDEIHAVAGSKRGSHLALTLQRLEALCQRPLTRIGLSATQKPIERVAQFLVGSGPAIPAPLNDAGVAARGDAAAPEPISQDRGEGFTPPQPSPARRGGSRGDSAFGRAGDRGDSQSTDSASDDRCTLIDIGYTRARDLALEVPPLPLDAVMSNDGWELIYNRIANLVEAHHTTLVFVNTRRVAERTARQLSERLGEQAVAAHHGSLSKEHRLDAEKRLKAGQLRVLVATASLELGIDIGDVELVCQLGSPRSIAAFLQRVGRSGHSVGGTPKGRLFATTRDELVECTALLDAVRRGELDALQVPPAPLDVLAQQLVAELAVAEWSEDALYDMVRGAAPYAQLSRADFDAVLSMLAEGFSTRRGQRAGYIHHDAVNRSLRGRRNARLTALTSGGTIPDTADYLVELEPQAQIIGSVNEDFAVESMAGDVFQLGNQSYRILRVERDRVRVEDAKGQPPSIPFWIGEAPGRTDELSFAVARLRREIEQQLDTGDSDSARAWAIRTLDLPEGAARQLIDYLAGAKAALGTLPTLDTLVIERFFDESGGMQLIVHSPYGSRLNRAWGLALRKRFCRSFNFELQAAATEDAIILSLSTAHSFALTEVADYLHSNSAEHVLTQALLDAPLFPIRWRWNAVTALALPRMAGGKRVPPQLQRMKSEDLLATVFPDQVACLENIVGERQIPDHPLVTQTLYDCLREAMDIDGLLALLRRHEAGELRFVACDLPTPSPLAAGILNAAPYAFLDDAPLEERRTQAVQTRRWGEGDDLSALDPGAIDAVRAEAWPIVRDADEMHEALMGLGGVTREDVEANPGWADDLARLARDGRATRLSDTRADGSPWQVWSATERLPQWQAIHADAEHTPKVQVPKRFDEAWEADKALVELLRARLTGLGPTRDIDLARMLGVGDADLAIALAALQGEGYVMQGQFTGRDGGEWCERHLLARIHRYTIGRLRREIEPVKRRDFLRFLFDWQHLSRHARVSGPDALAAVLAQLEGYEAAAGAWEAELLPARVDDYTIAWLDDLCRAGRIVWTRLRGPSHDGERVHKAGPVKSSPIVLLPRRQLKEWTTLAARGEAPVPVSSRAEAVLEALHDHGALFFDELTDEARLLRVELEEALGELVAAGRIHADSFAGLRALLLPAAKREQRGRRRLRRHTLSGIEDAGRWALIRTPRQQADDAEREARLEHIARTLLRRYGVVCWRLLEREAPWLPPWRELLRVYHRLEARGDIRGGRFVEGLVGEQFALPEAIELLRQVRRREHDGEVICISGSDPLNLVGTVLPGQKVPAVTTSRIAFRDGVPVAAQIAGQFTPLIELDEAEQAELRMALLRETAAFGPARV
ncbi:DEAD/DEAH box helicase [Oleiagrimonas sp. C23AA]|uniref:DEAD/DEAH box helicase n=1 Tax=Oleiagrimonas sp. C23AA TaxID=2719047 RepID=UPI00142319EF|nr:DEAD/DEAH box helicase [Oleiagrimonas sp. C23AA]NII10787.1 DEAD/DEAH box helicase [Oleiagrimonas sp. C23AA]